ncbi:Heme chaperone HemW [Geodia barretti]|uniref:Radical S-adenosyl methionine domain-containing protein 1, mitochondrial n=1 Tax=Geodia barretti TaxID=519541 RepID=A0AA35WA83_GEOBA|nr:Heme chaperone HemW [Geodia barretti]
MSPSDEYRDLPISASGEGISLYVHVPFCLSKCPYCDFNTYQGIESQFEDFLTAAIREIAAWSVALGRPTVNTIFLGGGTPSYLPDGDVARILDAIACSYGVRADAEITAECNPNDLTPAKCAELRGAGINRVSIGVQSMDNGLLSMLGRRHDAAEAAEALGRCRRAGFDNVSLDLMYGLPHQSLAQWRDTVGQVVALAPEHLSLYSLTLEEGTPLRRWVQQGRLPEPDPDLAADMYDHARAALAAAGYHHYEISNWTLPGRDSEHNLAYWRNLQWLGVGPGAHSSLRVGEVGSACRFWTVRSPRDYARLGREWATSAAEAGAWPAMTVDRIAAVPTVDGWEVSDEATTAAETMFLGLRLLDGMDVAAASARIGIDLSARYERELAELTADGLLVWESDDRLRLTEEAYLVGNQVFTRFLVE